MIAVSTDSGITLDELRLAARNHAMPLEALRWPITPVGLHYLLIHYDVPLVDTAAWRLELDGALERPATFTLEVKTNGGTLDRSGYAVSVSPVNGQDLNLDNDHRFMNFRL